MRIAILALLVVSVGCEKDKPPPTEAEAKAALAPVVKKHKDAKAAWKAMKEADADALEAKPVTAKEGNVKVETASNAVLLLSAGVLSDDDSKKIKMSWTTPDIGNLKTLFKDGTWGTSYWTKPSEVESHLEQIEKIEHLVLIRILDATMPKAKGSEFTPGEASGDVLIYEIPDAKRVAAYPISFTQQLESTTVDKTKANDQLERAMRDELLTYVKKLVAKGQ